MRIDIWPQIVGGSPTLFRFVRCAYQMSWPPSPPERSAAKNVVSSSLEIEKWNSSAEVLIDAPRLIGADQAKAASALCVAATDHTSPSRATRTDRPTRRLPTIRTLPSVGAELSRKESMPKFTGSTVVVGGPQWTPTTSVIRT